MDKINHALSGVEDNTARIIKIERKLKELADKMEKEDIKLSALTDDVQSLQTAQSETAAAVSSIGSNAKT